MKKLFLIFAIILILPFCSGCDKTFEMAEVSRNNEQTGGALSFEYNKFAGKITFGGEGEVVQFYEANLAKGWTEEGARVGIKIKAPEGLDNYEAIKVWVDGTENPPYFKHSYVVGQKTGEIELSPKVEDVEKEIEVKISWQSGSNEQKYLINFAKGTLLMKKQST